MYTVYICIYFHIYIFGALVYFGVRMCPPPPRAPSPPPTMSPPDRPPSKFDTSSLFSSCLSSPSSAYFALTLLWHLPSLLASISGLTFLDSFVANKRVTVTKLVKLT